MDGQEQLPHHSLAQDVTVPGDYQAPVVATGEIREGGRRVRSVQVDDIRVAAPNFANYSLTHRRPGHLEQLAHPRQFDAVNFLATDPPRIVGNDNPDVAVAAQFPTERL